MAKISVQAGSTSVSMALFIQASTSTAGLGLTGLTGTAANLIASYYRGTGTDVPIALTTSTLNAPYTSGLIVEINATRMAGMYRFDPPDAALAAGPRACVIMLSGAANMAPLPLEVELTAWNNQDATGGGMSQLTSTGTLGSVSNVRGTATVLLAGAVHTGAIIPQVQTASNVGLVSLVQTASNVGLVSLVQTASNVMLVNLVQTASNVGLVSLVSTASNVINVTGTATVVLAAGVHTGAIVPQVQTASNVGIVSLVQTASNLSGTVQLGTGTHTGAVIPTVNTVQTATISTAVRPGIRQNVALTNFQFPMYTTAGVLQTGLTVTAQRSIDGGSYGAGAISNIAEVANGFYKLDFAASDLNGRTVSVIASTTSSGIDTTAFEIVTDP